MHLVMTGIPHEGAVQATVLGTEKTQPLGNERMAVFTGEAPPTGVVPRRSVAAAVRGAEAEAIIEAPPTGMLDHQGMACHTNPSFLNDVAHRQKGCGSVKHHQWAPSFLPRAMTQCPVIDPVDSTGWAHITKLSLAYRTATARLSHPAEDIPRRMRR